MKTPKSADATIIMTEDGFKMTINDREASVRIAEISIDAKDFTAALGRLSHVKCEVSIYNEEKIGKTLEHKNLEFIVPSNIKIWGLSNKTTTELQKIAQEHCEDGWIADGYFGAQNTFFTKPDDDHQWARVTIRRWV